MHEQEVPPVQMLSASPPVHAANAPSALNNSQQYALDSSAYLSFNLYDTFSVTQAPLDV
jgi:hypothetical protein